MVIAKNQKSHTVTLLQVAGPETFRGLQITMHSPEKMNGDKNKTNEIPEKFDGYCIPGKHLTW